MRLPPAIFFDFTAPDWLDVQLLRPGAGYLVGKRTAPPIATEVCLDVLHAYHAHAGARFPAYENVPILNAINPLYFVFPTAF